MDARTKSRYHGYLSTSALWTGHQLSPFPQIERSHQPEALDDAVVFQHRRLGKLVEEFVFYQLKNQPSISWISDNLQIQDGKITVGEIDALYYQEETPVHLEVSYKFYLYDAAEDDNTPLGAWIGPNRKDSLVYKMEKLHRKQFPLLHHPLTRPSIEKYGLKASEIQQKLCFKAQLFLPWTNTFMSIHPLNPNCISGIYFPYRELQAFAEMSFFIPTKLDWLIIPHDEVDWLSYASAAALLETDINNQRSPMIWMKGADGRIRKAFVVFW